MKIIDVRSLLSALALCLAFEAPATAQLDPEEIFEGAVEIAVFPGHGIGVTVDELPQDGVAEAVFVLQANARIPPELPLRMRTARVTFEKDRLLIVSLEESLAAGLFLYRVDASDVERRLGGHLGQRYRGATPRLFLHGGHGLSRHEGRFPLPVESWPPAGGSDALDLEALGDITAQSDCDAGGPGSTSCSVSCGGTNHGCSTTCASGYYACCDCGFLVSTCTCVPDGSGGTGSGGGGGGGGGGDDSCSGSGYCPPECMACDPNAY